MLSDDRSHACSYVTKSDRMTTSVNSDFKNVNSIRLLIHFLPTTQVTQGRLYALVRKIFCLFLYGVLCQFLSEQERRRRKRVVIKVRSLKRPVLQVRGERLMIKKWRDLNRMMELLSEKTKRFVFLTQELWYRRVQRYKNRAPKPTVVVKMQLSFNVSPPDWHFKQYLVWLQRLEQLLSDNIAVMSQLLPPLFR